MMLSFNVKETDQSSSGMLKPERVKERSKREKKRDYAEGKCLLFFCPGKSRLTGGGGQFGATRIIILPHRLQTRPK
jgi:hypothetical protein